jgi:hypothetical protein
LRTAPYHVAIGGDGVCSKSIVEYAAPAVLVMIRYFFRFERTLDIEGPVCFEAPAFQYAQP